MATSRAESMMQKDERSLGDLISQLASDTGTLVRQEMRLVVAETRHNLSSGLESAAWLAAGLAVAAVGVLVLVAALVLVLSIWLPAWLSAIIVGIGLCAVGVPVANHGLTELKKVEIAPDDSIASIKESTEWLKEQIKN
ncbi:MAG: phage holin family protein [bacterium]|nr:phage holin family protein [bacterium]